LFSDYNLTERGIHVLAKELHKIKDSLHQQIHFSMMGTDTSAAPLQQSFLRACDLAAVACATLNDHPNSPDETGVSIYVIDPDDPPTAAKQLQTALGTVNIHAQFVKRDALPGEFTIFIGPAP
jgi:hypothetical protein